MNPRMLAGLVLLAFAVFYALTHPTDGADFVLDIASGIGAFTSAPTDGN